MLLAKLNIIHLYLVRIKKKNKKANHLILFLNIFYITNQIYILIWPNFKIYITILYIKLFNKKIKYIKKYII